MPYGPRKLVLINAGRYDYAEVELNGAIQLVGPNNTGKTTLINTLQFLYLDDRRHMDFGPYSEEETRAYYLPNQFSYILFEVLGSQGLHVIGWRGQSRIAGGDPERFVVSGGFEQADFLDDDFRVREPKAVSAKLALKQYTTIKTAQEFRDTLLLATRGEARGLGLVTLRDNDRYSQFRETLKNLLSLNTISQDQMRDQLLMMADLQKSGFALDVRQLFGDDYDRILKLKEKLVSFKRSQRDVQLLIETFDKREAIRIELCSRWKDLQAKRKAFEADSKSCIEQLTSEAERKKKDVEDAVTAIGYGRSRVVQLAGERGGIQTKLNLIEGQSKEFEGFLEPIARTALKNAQDELHDLQRQLEDSEQEDRAKAEQNVNRKVEAIEGTQRAIEAFDQALRSFLARSFSDQELSDLIRLFNVDILEQPIGPETILLRDPDAFVSNLKRLMQRIRDGVYQDETAELHLPPSHRGLNEIANVKALKERLREYQADLNRWKRILEAIKHRDNIAARITSLREQVEGKQDEHGNEIVEGMRKRLFRFEAFQNVSREKPALKAQLKTLEESMASENRKIDGLAAKEQELRDAVMHLADKERQVRNDLVTQIKNLNECTPPDLCFEPVPVLIADAFSAAIDQYREREKQLASLQHDFEQLHFHVERSLGSDYTGIDEPDSVRSLREELEALNDREKVLTRDWELQITNFRATFSEILKSLDDVKSAADRLNREFSRIRVSNLTNLRMEVIEATDVVGSMRRLVNAEQPGLFDEASSVERSIAAFRQKFEASPLLRYADLFTLRFTVTGDDGKVHHYHDFRQVESHGTTIAIKVLFNLLVLRSLLREDSQKGLFCELPFFLDEVHSLDSANRRTILDTARMLGFIAITAAPDSVSEVDALYFLQPQQGRITLRRKHRVHVKIKQQSA